MASIEQLPDDLLEFIFCHLQPYKDLEDCKLVCQRWRIIVKNVVRRSKMNLNKGLNNFRLSWHTFKNLEAMTPTIAGRFAHSAVVHENSMYVFGGGSSGDTTFNDLWRLDLSQMKWVRPLTLGSYPSPKGSATMLYYRDQLILFGGWRYPSIHPPYQSWCLFDELHLYDLKENRWTLQTPLSRPPPMAGHSATIHKQKMVVFGGYQIAGELNSNSNETWSLDLENFIWSKPKILGNVKPAPRYGQYQTQLDDNHLLIIGGCGGPNAVFNDAWILDMSNSLWQWKNIPIKDKKWGAAYMWCSPICKVGSNKLVVLDSTPNLPSDFQLIKRIRSDNSGLIGRNDMNQNNLIPHALNNVAPQGGRDFLRFQNVPQQVAAVAAPIPDVQRPNNNNRIEAPLQQGIDEDEAANRLQRNLVLRCRDNEPNLPRRFDEPQEDRFRMAAFIENRLNRNIVNRNEERIRRMEAKMNALRTLRREINEQRINREPTPKRVKRNVFSLYVCDISNALSTTEPHLKWIEYKNYGILPDSPERLILSSVVSGNGQLILFGGVHKETLTEVTHQVSNSVHFLTAPFSIY